MQLRSKYSWMKHIDFMIIDLIVLCISFWVSYTAIFHTPYFWLEPDWVKYLLFILLLNVSTVLITNPYSGILRRPYYMEIVRMFQITALNLLIVTFALYLLKAGALYSRRTSIYMYASYFVFSALCNSIWKSLLLNGVVKVETTSRVPLFVIGERGTIHQTINNVVAGDFMPYDIAGVYLVDSPAQDGTSEVAVEGVGKIPVVSGDYLQYILDKNIQEVLVTVAPQRVDGQVLERLNANAVDINYVIESVVGFQAEDQFINDIGVYKTVGVGAFSFTSSQIAYLALKRIIDVVCGIAGMILLIPTTLLVKLAYLISGDTAKIFYRQKRVGQNGKTIHIWKFRSMVPNAGEVLKELLKDEKYRKEWDENQKFENDPRITKVGDFLRKSSIDEFPQFINVLVGDMSLVGPRPLVEGELEKFGGLKLYQRVKPGITGWWACNGRSNIDYRERLELEYYYVKNCSLYLDVLCILRTIRVVLMRDGAQ